MKLKLIAAVVALPCGLWAMEQFRVPVDAEAMKQAERAVRETQQDHDSAAAIRAYRRWLEFYPNEPSVQAGIYRAMAGAFAQDGNEEQAAIWNHAAGNLDPLSGVTLPAGPATTRGATDKMAAILAAVNQTAQTVQAIRQSFNASNPNPAMPVPAPAFPQQPVGSAGYQPVPVTQPMPGYAPPQPQFAPPTNTATAPMQVTPQPVAVDPQGNPIQQPVPQQPMQPVPLDAQGNPMPQPMAPPQPQIQQMQPAPQPQQYQQPTQQYPQPQQYQPTQQYQQSRYVQPAPYQQQQPYSPTATQRPQYRQPSPYAQPRTPYLAPTGYARPQQARRGSAGLPIKVFHDHSRLGDSAYFDPPCPALLLVENGGLTFTPGGGEPPLLIPTSEIIEIRMNTMVAKEAGAFHIITKSGLYLALAPAGATTEEGRADLDELRKQLGLDQ